MQFTIEDHSEKFSPVTVTITLESEEELRELYEAIGQTPWQIGAPLYKEPGKLAEKRGIKL